MLYPSVKFDEENDGNVDKTEPFPIMINYSHASLKFCIQLVAKAPKNGPSSILILVLDVATRQPGKLS